MRETHLHFIERWVAFMKEHPTEWKKIHTDFINSQFHSHEQFLERLLQQPNGKKKVRELYKIKNLEGYPRFV
ncbi:MAG: hypothetical protein Q8R18_04075 [bacterium]|nr:hypothetical protein [bacterium]